MAAIFPEDIVVAVLHDVEPGALGKRVTADRQTLHTLFFKISRDDVLLRRLFRFRDKGLFPESEALDQAFSNLEASGLLQRQNTVPRFYFVQPSLADSFKRHVEPVLGDVNRETLRKAAADLGRLAG